MNYTTQNDLLLNKLLKYYDETNNLEKMINIINGNSRISLRIVDWFTTNYSKKNYTILSESPKNDRFKVYVDYKLNLKAYSKKRFDPFCRWERISIPYNDKFIQTTIGQLNFFKWALENKVVEYIENNYQEIENDMNMRNTCGKNKKNKENEYDIDPNDIKNNYDNNSDKIIEKNKNNKSRKKREELSISATKSIKKEDIEITVTFN